MPLLTLFTAPKPFTDPHIRVVQRNTLLNWQALGDDVAVVVVGDEPGITEQCQELGIRHLPNVRCNDRGTPLISSIFELARGVNNSQFLAYANADILFLPDLLNAVRVLADKKALFVAVGQRWDLDINIPFDFTEGWDGKLKDLVQREGALHGQTGSDYFIYPRACFRDIPDFAVGRAGWDNWMIYKARWEHWPVIELSEAVTVVHQNHDYSHLPGGLKHFFQPEKDINVQIGGGRRTIFTLNDATHYLEADKLKRKPLDWATFWREVEIFPLIRLHSRLLGWLSFALFHPVKAFNEVRGWLAYKLKKRQG
jgi:hypothetical protein